MGDEDKLREIRDRLANHYQPTNSDGLYVKLSPCEIWKSGFEAAHSREVLCHVPEVRELLDGLIKSECEFVTIETASGCAMKHSHSCLKCKIIAPWANVLKGDRDAE